MLTNCFLSDRLQLKFSYTNLQNEKGGHTKRDLLIYENGAKFLEQKQVSYNSSDAVEVGSRIESNPAITSRNHDLKVKMGTS